MSELKDLENEEQILARQADYIAKKKQLLNDIEEINKKIATASEEELENLNKLLKEKEKEKKDIDRKLKQLKQIDEIENVTLSTLIKQTKQLETQNKSLEKLKLTTNFLKNDMANLFNSAKNYTAELNSLDFSKINPTQAHKTLIDMEREAAKLGMRAGQGETGVKNLTKSFISLQKETGESSERAKEIVSTLSETGYVKNLNKAATTISLFTRATGMANSSAVDVMNQLTKIGKFGNKEASNMLANIAKIQKTNGITKNGMESIASSIGKTVTNMKAFGQTDMAIKKMVESTAKLVSGLEKVGMSAQEATGWIERLTDPEQIEKNIGLYAQLGMSISDALSGNLDGDSIVAGMKDFGQKLKDMGPIAGKAYAEAFGVSYKEAIKAADLNPVENVEEVPVDENLKALTEMKEATLDSSASMQDAISRMSGAMQSMGKRFLNVASLINSSINGAVFAAIVGINNFKKGLKGLKEQANDSTSSVTKMIFNSDKALNNFYDGNREALLEQINQGTENIERLTRMNEEAYKSGRITREQFLEATEQIATANDQIEEFKEKLKEDVELEIKINQETMQESIDENLAELNKKLINLTNDDLKIELFDQEDIEKTLGSVKEALNELVESSGEAQIDAIDKIKEQFGLTAESADDLIEQLNNIQEELEKNSGINLKVEASHELTEMLDQLTDDINSVEKIPDGLRQAARDLDESIRSGGDNASRKIKNGMNQGANNVKNKEKQGHVEGSEIAKRKIKEGMQSGSGGMLSKFGLVAATVGMIAKPLLELSGLASKMGKNKVLRYFGEQIGLNMDSNKELTEAIEANTSSITENTKVESGGPENIFIDGSKVKTTGLVTGNVSNSTSIVQSEPKPSRPINTTTKTPTTYSGDSNEQVARATIRNGDILLNMEAVLNLLYTAVRTKPATQLTINKQEGTSSLPGVNTSGEITQ